MDKLTVQDLAAILSKKTDLNSKEALRFVNQIFEIIHQGVDKDKLVKIKGLGTFKLIGVEARESVNVNTGERVLIDSHAKISFTPDSAMKELVNKPFSGFETVVLNEGVTFDEDLTVKDTDKEAETEKDDGLMDDEQPVDMAVPAAEDVAPYGDTVGNEIEEEAYEPESVDTISETSAGEQAAEAVQPEETTVVYELENGLPEGNRGETEVVSVLPEEITVVSEEENGLSDEGMETEEGGAAEPEGAAAEAETVEPEEVATAAMAVMEKEQETIIDLADDHVADIVETNEKNENMENGDMTVDNNPSLDKRSFPFGWVIFVIALCGASFGVGYYLGSESVKPTEAKLAEVILGTEFSEVTDSFSTTVPDTIDIAEKDTLNHKEGKATETVQTTEANKDTEEETSAEEKKIANEKSLAEQKAASEVKKPETQKAEEKKQQPKADYMKYDAMDERVRTGAYYIMGTAEVVKAKNGETLELLSRRYLGNGMVCYLEVYNGLTAKEPLKDGQEVKIPKIELKKIVKKRLNNK